MQNLKYYVLGIKNSPLLKQYLEKYYIKLRADLKEININTKLLNDLLNHNQNRVFILDADISSLINSVSLENNCTSLKKLEEQIEIFLSEGKDSENLTQNKGTKIKGTNIRLTLNDDNPYKGFESHPDKVANGGILGWGEKNEKGWLEIYEKTFNLLKNVDSGIYYELNDIITKIVPLGTSRNMHNSSSYKECIGHIYLGYTINSPNPEINNLEAIIHESSHNKLNLIMQFDTIVLNDKTEKYYSAIRPDARHIHGVLLGYHAFAPTIYIVMKAYINGHIGNDESWLEKITLYYIKVKFLQKVMLKYAKFTKLGFEINLELDYVVSEMDILFKKLKPSKKIIKMAKENQRQHFSEVNASYLNLEY